MIPRFGAPPEPARAYTLRPGVYAILPRAGRVLLTVQMDLEWDVQLPGGGIDPGEQTLQALHREVLEETGWRIARPQRLGVFQRFTYMPEYDLWAQKMCSIFVAHPVQQIMDPTEAEHRSWWALMDQAIEVIGNAGDRALLQRYARGF